jgi:3-methyladenine DNA glycosylase AlkC
VRKNITQTGQSSEKLIIMQEIRQVKHITQTGQSSEKLIIMQAVRQVKMMVSK